VVNQGHGFLRIGDKREKEKEKEKEEDKQGDKN
jgi:hypothetical protein